ncbi:MAG: PAS domain-containing sensor histidine kinase [Acetobacteraceae bacterium]
MKQVRFNLRLWFFLTGFGVMGALSAGFALLMTQYLFSVLLQREVSITREFLESIVRSEELDVSVFAPGASDGDPRLNSFATHVRRLSGTLRANIYALDSSILWSTDAGMTGRRFDDNDELRDALQGRTISEVVQTGEDTKAEHIALVTGDTGYFVEAYLPIRGPDGILTVVELYLNPVAMEAMLREGRRMVWLSAAAGALILFCALFWIVRRAAHLIERQQTDLHRMEALAALGQMAGGIAHNLRNPMAGIRSSAELLQLEVPDAMPVAADIIGEVDRLERTVRQLLEFTRAESPSLQRLDPLALVNDILSQHKSTHERASVFVNVDDRRQARRAVDVDPFLIGQAMTSIIVNAMEAMPEGGVLHVQLYDDGPLLCLSFTDTGTGVPAEMLARIAEPFFTTKTRGLGLGLALARRIVERFGGALDIANADGRGACVRIALAAA